MISRIYSVVSIVFLPSKEGLASLYHIAKEKFHDFSESAKDYLLGDLRNLDPIDILIECQKDKNGISIKRLGRPSIGLGVYLVTIQPHENSPIIHDQLKKVMNIDTANARLVYRFFDNISNSKLSISHSGAEGLKLRSRFIKYLNPRLYYESSLANSTLSQDLYNASEESQKKSFFLKPVITKILKKHIGNELTQTIFGFELNDSLYEILQEITDLVSAQSAIIPSFLNRWSNTAYAKVNKRFDLEVKKFLNEHIKLLKAQMLADQEIKPNLFIEILLEKYPIEKLMNLSDREIEKLTQDPEVRTSITALLAANNISTAVDNGFCNLFLEKLVHNEIQEKLADEKEIPIEIYMDKAAMPLLHAFWLETLRYEAPQMAIARYTNKEIKSENLSVPARSIIMFDLRQGLNNSYGDLQPLHPPEEKQKTFDDSSLFKVERFLTVDRKLNERAKQFQAQSIAFGGKGGRHCPAERLSELLFKKYIVYLGTHLSYRVAACEIRMASRNSHPNDEDTQLEIDASSERVQSRVGRSL